MRELGGFPNCARSERIKSMGGSPLAGFLGILRSTGILTNNIKLKQVFDRRTIAAVQEAGECGRRGCAPSERAGAGNRRSQSRW